MLRNMLPSGAAPKPSEPFSKALLICMVTSNRVWGNDSRTPRFARLTLERLPPSRRCRTLRRAEPTQTPSIQCSLTRRETTLAAQQIRLGRISEESVPESWTCAPGPLTTALSSSSSRGHDEPDRCFLRYPTPLHLACSEG